MNTLHVEASMYTEDYLIRMIRRLAEAVGRWVRSGSAEDRAEVEDAVQGSLGLSIATLDALPASALANLLRPGDDLAQQRVEAAASLLEALADLEEGPSAEGRRRKAEALRAAWTHGGSGG